MLLRTGPYGDRFGLRRGGLNLDKLRAHPHGLVLAEHAPTGVLDKVVRHPGGKVRLDPPEIVAEVGRLGTACGRPCFRCWRSGFAGAVAEFVDAQQPHPDEGRPASAHPDQPERRRRGRVVDGSRVRIRAGRAASRPTC